MIPTLQVRPLKCRVKKLSSTGKQQASDRKRHRAHEAILHNGTPSKESLPQG